MKQQYRRLSLFTLHFSLFTSLFSLFTLHASLAQSRPDPGFMAVAEPPFDAADVWVDTEINGYGTYFGGLTPTGMPIATGDPLWPEHINRVYARVRNFGNAIARNLTINFYVRQPAGIGNGGYWELIGTLRNFGPIQPNSFRDGFILWTPATDIPASFKAEIEPLAGEASTSNNSVIEGSSFFTNNGFHEFTELDFLVHNPSETSGVNLTFEAVITPQSQAKTRQAGSDWQVVLGPESRYLRAGFDCTVRARVIPPNPCLITDGRPAQITITGYSERPNQPRTQFGGATLFARSTRVSAITMECLGDRPNFFTGRLLEESCLEGEQEYYRGLKRRNEPVVLEYRSPTDRVITRTTRTDPEGIFFDDFTPDERGPWSVQAHWIGDAKHGAAFSVPCTFEAAGCPPPVITCPSDVTLVPGDDCTAVFDEMATVISDCEVTVTSDPELPIAFSAGIYTVTYTAADEAGNSVTCTTTVTVIDALPPVITCPDFTYLLGDVNCLATFNDMATATDDCDADVTITSDPPLPATFGYGTHVVTFTATDDAGNTAMCTTTVFVDNVTVPIANAGPDQIISSNSGVTVTLDGTGSLDPDGQTLAYFWEQISGDPVTLDNPTSPTPSYFQPIDYMWREFRLTVTDPCGATAMDTVRVFAHLP